MSFRVLELNILYNEREDGEYFFFNIGRDQAYRKLIAFQANG